MAAGTNWSPKNMAKEETKMEMTPMIDVVFLLLIFFLCTIKFKILEGKIPAYMPKDVGVNTTPIDDQLERIEIHVVRSAPHPPSPNEDDPNAWIWDQDQISISIGAKRIANLKDFHTTIKGVIAPYKNLPRDEWPKANFIPHKGTLYIDAVKVINECLRAEFTQITFQGAPADA